MTLFGYHSIIRNPFTAPFAYPFQCPFLCRNAPGVSPVAPVNGSHKNVTSVNTQARFKRKERRPNHITKASIHGKYSLRASIHIHSHPFYPICIIYHHILYITIRHLHQLLTSHVSEVAESRTATKRAAPQVKAPPIRRTYIDRTWRAGFPQIC